MKNNISKYENESSNWLQSFFDLPFINRSNILKTNIRKEGNDYVYEIDVAGYNKDDIVLNYEDGYLIIETKINKHNSYSNDNYIHQERYNGTCSRSFYIGEIDESKINAKYNNGLLTVTFPSDDNSPKYISKKINIQ